MRIAVTAILVAGFLLLPPSKASIVLQDPGSRPGIVAESEWNYLDSYGRVWRDEGQGYFFHMEEWDVPIPVEEIRFWSAVRFVTMTNEFYWFDESAGAWVNLGTWQSPASAAEEAPANEAPMAAIPSPSTGSTHVNFRLTSPGHVTVQIFDAVGRLRKTVMAGDHPAGYYSIVWDGADDQGVPSEAGTYFAIVRFPHGQTEKRVTLIR